MKIGYACKCITVPETQLHSCTASKATTDRLMELIDANLNALDRILTYNIKNGIDLFRISSDIIPFGSSPVNTLNWAELFSEPLKRLGDRALAAGIRHSMHPGQYTVLNSPDQDVVNRAVLDLEYHCTFLDAMGLPPNHKIILHIGGVYGDREGAVKRFCENYKSLSECVRARLIIENDERNYNIEQVCRIGMKMGIPVVFDNLHHALNLPRQDQPVSQWLRRCAATWQSKDGTPKVHYAQQDPGKRPGAHSQTIRIPEFLDYLEQLPDHHFDIMLEVKDKNISALKCLNCSGNRSKIKDLEEEWARYKYAVLAHSQPCYQQIRQLLKDKSRFPAVEFYQLIDQALGQQSNRSDQLNAINHVWGYFKDRAAVREKNAYLKKLEQFTNNQINDEAFRRFLYKMAQTYHEEYLLNSYYFDLG